MFIKKRLARPSNRGVYLQDKELKNTKFQPDTHFKYILDIKNNKIIILPTENNTKNTVSKRQLKNGSIKPVIDIRQKDIKQLVSSNEYLQITISSDKILIEGFKNSSAKENIIQKAIHSIKNKVFRKVIDIESLFSVEKTFEVTLSNDFKKASGFDDIGFSNKLSFLDNILDKNTAKKVKKSIKIPLQVNSYFSGAGMMDKAFKDAGFDIIWGIEIDKEACKTYKTNIGNHIINSDITKYNKNLIPSSPIKIAGTPCFGFTCNNRRTNFLDNPNNILVREFIESIRQDAETKVFVLENVPQILTAGNGAFKDEILESLSDFHISYGILNSADYGDPQIRDRAIFIGSRLGKIKLPTPILNKNEYVTVREAFKGLSDSSPNQLDYTKAKPQTIERMKFVPPGGNFKNIPIEIRPKGQHSDVYKRLEWDKPSITVVNPRKSNILHPTLNRILSIRECARLQGLPDEFIFKGILSSMQQQVANGTAYNFMKTIAEKIKEFLEEYYSDLSLEY